MPTVSDADTVLVWPPRVAAPRRLMRRMWGCPLHDRYLLEQIIFRQLRSRTDVRSILFVGCAHYTRRYPASFDDREFLTIDPDPGQAQYGGPTHFVDALAKLSTHVAPASLDVVICNGVIGWGLNDPDEIEASVDECFECLRPAGLFIIGWNDLDGWRPPVPLAELTSLRRFEPILFPPFPLQTYPALNDLRHVFSFYGRPTARNA